MRSLNVWLIGETCENFNESFLITKRAVLEVFLFHYKVSKKSRSASFRVTADKIIELAKKIDIETPHKSNIATKVRKLYSAYESLQKLKNRNSQREIDKRRRFADEISNVFAFAKSAEYKERHKEPNLMKKASSIDMHSG